MLRALLSPRFSLGESSTPLRMTGCFLLFHKNKKRATIGRPPLHAIKVCFREAKRLPYNQFFCFRRGGVSPPATKPNNFPNEQGLGGSRCGSVTVRFKHHTVVFFIAAPSLRYLPVSGSKSAPWARADCLSAN